MGLFGVAIALVALPDLTEAFKDEKRIVLEDSCKGSISTFLIGFVSFIFYFLLQQKLSNYYF